MTKENAITAYNHYKEVAEDSEKYPMLPKLRENSVNAMKDMKEKLMRSYGIDIEAKETKSKEKK